MLNVENLKASIEGQNILKGLDLKINPGEVHAIMGPNGSGKSTFAKVLAGHPDYEVTGGSVAYSDGLTNEDLLSQEETERARKGIFLSFQYPVEIQGVSNKTFLKAAFDSVCESQGASLLSDEDFNKLLNKQAARLKMDISFLERSVNEGFSGGEKKRNEMLQMLLLNPRLVILDELDSGLDVDSLRIVSQVISEFKSKSRSFIFITHYHRILDLVKPDYVHIISDGRIVKTGSSQLALDVEKKGYQGVM